MIRRLAVRIYLAMIAAHVFTMVVVVGFASLLTEGDVEFRDRLAMQGTLIVEDLDGPEARRRIAERVRRAGLDLTVHDPSGRPLQVVGHPLPPPDLHGEAVAWLPGVPAPAVQARLADGRWITVALPGDGARRRFRHFLAALLLLAVALALGSWPLARSLTRRLEALRAGVDRWGEGELGARVAETGPADEVGRLAVHFNRAADRVQALVQAQRRMLASASHELRSPLARLRMSLALLDDEDPSRQELVEGAVADIGALDALVDDLLVAARLQSGERATDEAPVDLADVVADEPLGDRTWRIDGHPVVVGDARLLRRAVRNLVENARRHGGGDVEGRVLREGDRWVVEVADRGPGVSEDLRERIFEPFFRPQGHSEGRDGGVGLGLALVRDIARHHGGEVRCEDRAGGGSCFRLVLPAAREGGAAEPSER